METSPKDDWSAFERSWTRKMIGSVNQVRESQGLTVKELASRLNSVGWPVSTATLSGMLSGDKRGSISVAEWAAFSRVLNVPPLFILLGLTDSKVPASAKIWGDKAPTLAQFSEWFMHGVMFSAFQDPDAQSEQRTKENESARLARQVLGLLSDFGHALDGVIWQSAQLVAASSFDEEVIASALSSEFLDQNLLWEAMSRLRVAIDEIKTLPNGWAVHPADLPESLAKLFETTNLRSEFSTELLESWVTSSDVEEARNHIAYIVKVHERDRSRGIAARSAHRE